MMRFDRLDDPSMGFDAAGRVSELCATSRSKA